MHFKYSARYDFPKMGVTFNPGTEYEFKNSMIDFYGNSLDDLLKIDVSNHERINLDEVKSYDRIISKWDFYLERWITVDSSKIHL